MASEERPQEVYKSLREPLSPAKKSRLEKVFEHATMKAGSSTDYDYINELLMQCVLGDPGNGLYVRHFIENLQKKYNNNKKGHPLGVLKIRSYRSAIKKALAAGQWDEVIQHGLNALTINPWDIPTLLAMATAANKMNDRDCEMLYLKWAATNFPKDPVPCRLYAIALGERQLYDQAIAWWHRVEEALPDDDEARRAIGVLTVQKARSRGEYDDDETTRMLRVRAQHQEDATLEQRLLQKIEQTPKEVANYLELAQLYVTDERYSKAEELLAKAFEISDGDPDIREKWEDAQLRHLRQKMNAAKDPETKKKLQRLYFEKDLEACKNRSERYPGNLAFKYELGYRYMLLKHYAEAIRELQVAKNDPRRKGVCMLALGQCFQHIKQYRLAMSHYDWAIQEIPDRDAENKKRALHLAGRLALALKDLDAAEKYLTTLAGLDFTYRDVSALLDKIAKLRENPGLADGESDPPPKPKEDGKPSEDDA